MKNNFGLGNITAVFLFILIGVNNCSLVKEDNVGLFYDQNISQHKFAANDIKSALEAKGFSVEVKDIDELSEIYGNKKIVIALATNNQAISVFKGEGGISIKNQGEQAYTLKTTNEPAKTYWIFGGDENGAMYGGLQIAEYINFNGLNSDYNEEESPYIKNRGIKFNIPLDRNSPTYYNSTDGTSHKIAISHVWDMNFWKTWFDEMARHRYNVLSLWSPHPFTSMLNMEDEYPGIAIQGVTGFGENDEEIRINEMTIDEKVRFWRKVMKYGRDRGFGTYFCNWNIFLSTAEAKHGLTHDPYNEKTKIYMKKCMIKFLETYPDLAGFGITVGERMGKLENLEKEKWAWDTYGSGMMEYAQANPSRDLVFIHRQHWGNLDNIWKYFKPLSDLPNVRFDLSFKYSQAHAHTTATPARWKTTKMEEGLGPRDLKSWLTIRNDDWYFLHWAEPSFVRDYINNFPEIDKYVNAFYIGSDGWVFTKVFTSKDSYYEKMDALSIQRTWLMQKLWGRISYNPSVSDDLFINHINYKFPEISAESLFEAWSNASGSIRLANEQVTGDWDLDRDWWPEGWTFGGWHGGEGRFYSLEDTKGTTPFKGSNLCSLAETANGKCGEKISAWETVEKIDKMASNALIIIESLESVSNKELLLTLKDISAQAYLGLYNAYKFRAVMFADQNKRPEALKAIETAYCYWKKYTSMMDGLYYAVDLQRNLNFSSWVDHDQDALRDYIDLGGKSEPDCLLK